MIGVVIDPDSRLEFTIHDFTIHDSRFTILDSPFSIFSLRSQRSDRVMRARGWPVHPEDIPTRVLTPIARPEPQRLIATGTGTNCFILPYS